VAELVDARVSDARAHEAWEFESPSGDCGIEDANFPGEAGARLAFIRPIRPVRYRGLGLCGWAGARPSFIRSEAEVRLPDPQLSVFMARYANWHRDQVESLVSVGSNPTRATAEHSSRRLAAKTPALQAGYRRFESCRDDSQPSGPRVFRPHASLVRRWTEFDSRADLYESGLLVQQHDACLARRRSGCDSPAVH
jgi:hypothetical protein